MPTSCLVHPTGNGSNGHAKAKTAQLVNGKVTEGPDLSVTVNGMRMPNPFVIGSGPPGTNYQVRACCCCCCCCRCCCCRR
jgi:hypothetical protein